ncbi:hypothetical protein ACHAW5_002381 [Stephanodiscus triporus]|uniref:Uncharacterized protein n=1 Tax=Stephanodiscus triporus TaxID=2934178 RepID=A0ABD3NWG0_9STRA
MHESEPNYLLHQKLICPGLLLAINRAAKFTDGPKREYSYLSLEPVSPQNMFPNVIPIEHWTSMISKSFL